VNQQTNTDETFFNEHFSKCVEKAKINGELLLAYDGVLNSETIAKLENEIESKIVERNYSKTAIKKVFFISIESLQNMFIHGFKDDYDTKHNFFVLYVTNKQVIVVGANLIANVAIPKISNHIERINSFTDPAELKGYYLEHLENNELSEKGGAGLGFITIGMKSGNKLRVEFQKINDIRSMFLMEVTINKE
jgi:hypothetical protein